MTSWVEEWLDHVPDLASLCHAFPDRFPYLLESTARGPLARYSLLLFAGEDLLVCKAVAGESANELRSRFFDQLAADFERERIDPESAARASVPFIGGWFLYFGYEMASGVETGLDLPANRTGLPDAIAHRCPGAIVVVHARNEQESDRAMLVAENESVSAHLRACLEPSEFRSNDRPEVLPPLEQIQVEDPQRYEAAVHRIQDYLAAGDVFQVNVSRQWTGRFASTPEPMALYQSLMSANPAPFAGLMRWGQQVLLSSSPERLVQTRGQRVQTRPIAGTRPRGANSHHDEALSRELISNLKERAEHVMLIDLERNDLGRVCQPGSIEVNELMVVESYAHVHHIVSNVQGVLNDSASPVDAIRAVFPGGTITGCPKVRCMEIIAELEQDGRGFYTGSMGYLGIDGTMDLNILIRSLLLDEDRFSFRTGAGIVVDSDPEKEVLETADKARGMLLALEGLAKEENYAGMPG